MSLYEVLKASKTERFPDYWTLLWGRKLSASMIKTITGVLPLTFTSKGGNAVDWVIEGNDDNGTENLFDAEKYVAGVRTTGYGISKIASTANEISVTPISNYSTWYTVPTRKKSDGNMPQTAGTQLVKIDAEGEQAYTLNLSSNNPLTGTLTFTNENFETLNENYIVFSSAILPFTFTTPQGTKYIFLRFGNNNVDSDTIITNVMIVEGSTAPDHYIPYQQGVGQRTENLFDIGTSASDYVGASIGVEIDEYNLSMNIVASGSTWTYRNKKILTTGEHTVSLSSDKTYPRVYIALRNQDDSGWLTDSDASISGFSYNSYYHGWFKDVSRTTGNVATSVIIPSCLYWQIGFGYNSIAANVGTIGTLSNIMLVEGSTVPDHYIPYGYQIPLTVSQQGQPDKSYTFYIGDTPLTEGQQVSKTSTGQDIELFEGENTISTTLYNKPEMEIKYK